MSNRSLDIKKTYSMAHLITDILYSLVINEQSSKNYGLFPSFLTMAYASDVCRKLER